MSATPHSLACYIPALIADRLHQNGAVPSEPFSERFQGAALFADTSGFTRLTEQLLQRDGAGLEEISRILNHYFGRFAGIVAEAGGDIVKFAGDALLVLWRAEGALQDATLRAAQCGLRAQALLHDYPATEDIRLSMRIGIGSGEFLVQHLGGVFNRWDFVITGDPIRQVSRAKRSAQPGETALSHEAWRQIAPICSAIPVEISSPSPIRRLDSLRETAPPLASALPACPVNEAAVRAYIPDAILSRAAAGQWEYLSELRDVTGLFISLPDFQNELTLAQAQDIMVALQTEVYRFEGSINKISVDDKGVMVLAAFGLPPLAHEDDAVRAIRAALRCCERLRALGARHAIGLATGRAFCGTIGSDVRREYTLIGAVINMAARLTGQAENAQPLAILCNEATTQAVHSRFTFQRLADIEIPGLSGKRPVYTPLGECAKTARAYGEVIGRAREQRLLNEAIEHLRETGTQAILILEGEAGLGKTRLIEGARERARQMGLHCLCGAGDPIEKAAAYHGWRGIFTELLGLEGAADMETRRHYVTRRLDESQRALAPLLNAMLPLDFAETPEMQAMSGQVRANNTRRLLVELLGAEAKRGPLIVCIEDAHWLDSASWNLLQDLSENIPLLLLLATRPFLEAPSPEYERLKQLPQTTLLKLSAMPDAECLALVCRRLGVDSLPTPVAALIQARAGGNPLFTEEIAYALRDVGLIEIADGNCRVAAGVDLNSIAFPTTLQGVITSRIDRLQPEPQFAMKVASVIGTTFALRMLRDVHPLEADKSRLSEYLDTLEQFDLTLLETQEPDMIYAFKHIITRDVAYNMMLFSLRRRLHQALAEWHERMFAQDLSPFYPILAYHWGKAEVTDKAVAYLEKAAMRSQYLGLPKEAVQFGLEAAHRLGVDLPTTREALGAAIQSEMQSIEERLAGRRPADLIHLPPLTETRIAEAIRLVLNVQPAAFISQQAELFALMALKNLTLTLMYGHASVSPGVYSMYSIVSRAISGDSRTAYEYSVLARELDARQGHAMTASLNFVHIWFNSHWINPLRDSLELALEGHTWGMEKNDLLYGCFNLGGYVVVMAASGHPLSEVIATAGHHSRIIDNRVSIADFHCLLERQFARALAGQTIAPLSLTDSEVEEEQKLASILQTENYNQIGYYLLSKSRLAYYYREYALALEYGEKALKLLPSFQGQIAESELFFFLTLAMLARSAEVEAPAAETLRCRAAEMIDRLRAWSETCEANYLHKFLLAQAEQARVTGRREEALALYDEAARSAEEHGYVQHAALAHELAARCCQKPQDWKVRKAFLEAAREAYTRWGAHAKVRDLQIYESIP